MNKINSRTLISLLVCLSLSTGVIHAKDLYVDIDVSTSGDGTSWGTAWKNLFDIDWNAVDPGDTIWISGGRYPLRNLRLMKSGTPGNPIRIKASQESGHNDQVILDGSISVGATWITIDGAKDDNYGDTHIRDNTLLVPLIKNNINMVINSDSRLEAAPGLTLWANVVEGVSLKWLKVETSDEKHSYGVLVNGTPEGVDLGYLWIYNTGQDGVYMPGNKDPSWDDLVVHHCLIEGAADDGIESSGGLTVHHTIIRDSRNLHGHPDGIQSPGTHLRIYSNILHGTSNQLVYLNIQKNNHAHVHVYGNLIYACRHTSELNEAALNIGVDAGYIYHETVMDANTSDWIYVNNTIISHSDYGPADPLKIWNRYAADGLVIHPTGIIIKNNILYNGTDIGFSGIPLHGGWEYDETEIIFDYNLIYSNRENGNRISWITGLYANAEAFNAATSFASNTSQKPLFVDEVDYDFSLAAADTAATKHGEDLSSLGLIGLDKDLAGNARGGAGWAMGAFEAGSDGAPITEPDLAPVADGPVPPATPTPSPPGSNPTPLPPFIDPEAASVQNVFNPLLGQSFDFPISSNDAKGIIYDRKGRKVDNMEVVPGFLRWDGKNDKGEIVASSVYSVLIETPEGKKTRKVVVIK